MNPTTASPSNLYVSPSTRLLIITLQKSSQTFPTYFDCDNHAINFTYDKNCRVFDIGQWQLTVSTPVGTMGVFERRYPHYPRDLLL